MVTSVEVVSAETSVSSAKTLMFYPVRFVALAAHKSARIEVSFIFSFLKYNYVITIKIYSKI